VNKSIFHSVLSGCLIAAFSFLLSNFLQGPSAFSWHFITLSFDPFSTLKNPIQYRFLVPLLGYLTGLKGQYYYILSLLGNVFFLIMVNYWGSKFYQSRLTAFLLAATMACLPVVLLNDSYYGWSDIFCYALLLVALLSPRYCFWAIFLGLCAHEFFGVYIHFIFLYYYRFHRNFFEDKKKIMMMTVSLAAALLLYGLARLWITIHFKPEFSVGFYSGLISQRGLFCELRGQPLLAGFFSAYKMSSILFIPFLYFILRYRRTKILDIMVLLSALLPAVLLFIAHDTTRFFSNTFIFILLFPKYMGKMRNGLLAFILFCNALIPTFCFDPGWRAPLDKQAAWIFKKINAHERRDDAFAKIVSDFDIKALIKLCAQGS